jgi:hypothetical protein
MKKLVYLVVIVIFISLEGCYSGRAVYTQPRETRVIVVPERPVYGYRQMYRNEPPVIINRYPSERYYSNRYHDRRYRDRHAMGY